MLKLISKSLKNTLIVSYLAITVLVLGLVGAIFYGFIERYADQKEAEVVESSARLVAAELVSFIGRQPNLDDMKLFFDSIESLQDVAIDFITADGDSLFDLYDGTDRLTFSDARTFTSGMAQMMNRVQNLWNENRGRQSGMMGRPEISGQVLARSNDLLRIRDAGRNVVVSLGVTSADVLIGGKAVDPYILIENDSDVRGDIIRPALVSFGLASLIALVFAGLSGWLMGRKLANPLVKLSRSAGSMGAGDLKVRAGREVARRADELGLLAREFNSMASKLEKAIGELSSERDTLKHFLSDASHELRTPLTALISYLELLEGKGGDDQQRKITYIERGQVQAERMRRIVSQLLELSRMENKTLDDLNDMEPCSLNLIVQQAVQSVVDSGTFPDSSIVVKDGQGVLSRDIVCDRQVLTGVLQNIISNGVKFSAAAHNWKDGTLTGEQEAEEGIPAAGNRGKVEIRMELLPGKQDSRLEDLVVTVTDDGPGIPEQDLTRVFDRFYRSSERSVEGSGLGLAIARSGIVLHKGTIRLDNRTDGTIGAICTVHLPEIVLPRKAHGSQAAKEKPGSLM